MADKEKSIPSTPDRDQLIEKGQQSGKLSEHSIPDFNFTPAPPPPPPSKSDEKSN